MPPTRRLRVAALAAASVMAAAASALLGATPAHAADVSSWSALTSALSGCTGTVSAPLELRLTGDAEAATTELALPCSVDLDLNGYRLSSATITVPVGHRLTVRSSTHPADPDYSDFDTYANLAGKLTAVSTSDARAGIFLDNGQLYVISGAIQASAPSDFDGGGEGGAAGIGGNYGTTGGYVRVEGGMVRAQGGQHGNYGGAGIGSGPCGLSATAYEQFGGDVVATGGGYGTMYGGGAAIGGGGLSEGGQAWIHGGRLTAYGGDQSVGIGHGAWGLSFGCDDVFLPFVPDAFVVIDGGEVYATATRGSGLGAWQSDNPADVTISGGTVTAHGGLGNSGIAAFDDGEITITGGEVIATTTEVSVGTAAIGGRGSTLTVSGGRLTATGTSNGPGIGTSQYDGGMTVIVEEGGTLVATGGSTAIAVDGASDSGQMIVDGDLVIPAGQLVLTAFGDAADAEVVVGATGRILGADLGADPSADPTTGATITGSGAIENNGVIALAEEYVEVDVWERNYLVEFDGMDAVGDVVALADGVQALAADSSVRVFAASFDTGFRDFPEPGEGMEWNTEPDGSGDTVDASTALTGDITLYEVEPFVEDEDEDEGGEDEGGEDGEDESGEDGEDEGGEDGDGENGDGQGGDREEGDGGGPAESPGSDDALPATGAHPALGAVTALAAVGAGLLALMLRRRAPRRG